MNPLDAINLGFVPGLNAVGEQFELGEMFLPDLVLAGEAMKAATPRSDQKFRRAAVHGRRSAKSYSAL